MDRHEPRFQYDPDTRNDLALVGYDFNLDHRHGYPFDWRELVEPWLNEHVGGEGVFTWSMPGFNLNIREYGPAMEFRMRWC